MSNFLLQFLSLPREDTKRFEILNIISSILEWTDEQRQKAGLARISDVRRTNSNPMLSDFPQSPLSPGKEVLPPPPRHVTDERVCRNCGLTFYRRRPLQGRLPRTGWGVLLGGEVRRGHRRQWGGNDEWCSWYYVGICGENWRSLKDLGSLYYNEILDEIV